MMKVRFPPFTSLHKFRLLTRDIAKDKERRKLMKERTGGKHY